MVKFIFGKNDFRDWERAEENCFLLTNGLGGYTSLTISGSSARNDQALLMAAIQAPNVRYHLLTNVQEKLCTKTGDTDLASQRYVNRTKNQEGFKHINSFSMKYLPQWIYQIEGIEITKTIVMAQGENTVGIRYQIRSPKGRRSSLIVTPLLRFCAKNNKLNSKQKFLVDDTAIESEGICLFYSTNGKMRSYDARITEDLYFEQDARDGRDAVGAVITNHDIIFDICREEEDFYLIYRMNPGNSTIEELIEREKRYQEKLIEHSEIKNEVGQCLVKSADQYITYRESTRGKSIIAGYPYFEDWGRDTMIALPGCTLATKRFEDCKSILRTFMAYCCQGLMPNLFPEGGQDPMYNTVDAPLLFIEAVYEYYVQTKDCDFIKEAWPTMKEIIYWYKNGTDYHIKMDEDCLIMAGEGLEQLTWMDVRIGEILPTPRHGKPVEINAYWYNALMIMTEVSAVAGEEGQGYQQLAEKVKSSFCKKFWNKNENCLKDVISGNYEENQVRCNQIWALSLPFSMVEKEKAELVLKKVYENLYTPIGLRTLSPSDRDFHPFYGGSQFERDLAYHQGTVWAFPLGAYYRAVLRFSDDRKKAKETVKKQLEALTPWLSEGCLGHVAEIYDGKNPVMSKGCYAQAWSVGELLRVYAELERE